MCLGGWHLVGFAGGELELWVDGRLVRRLCGGGGVDPGGILDLLRGGSLVSITTRRNGFEDPSKTYAPGRIEERVGCSLHPLL